MAHEIISAVVRDYRWYHGVSDGYGGPRTNVPVDVPDDPDDIFVQEALWEGDGEPSFTADARLVFGTAWYGFQRKLLPWASRSLTLYGA